MCDQARELSLGHPAGYLFMIAFRIYGYGFQRFFASSGFMAIVFYQNSVIGELFWLSRIYGYDFQKFSRFMGIRLRNLTFAI